MEIEKLKELTNDPSKLISVVQASRPEEDDDWKQYYPENHAVMQKSSRKDREVWKPVYDSNGQPVKIEDGQPGAGTDKMTKDWEKVARITSSAQKMIVQWAVQIAAGTPVEPVAPNKMDDKQERKYKMLLKTLKDNKIDYLDKEILRLKKTYKICAEVWYSEDAEKSFWGDLMPGTSKVKKMRLLIMSTETGDDLYPIRNKFGKMIALGRGYKIRDDEGKEVSKFDLYVDNGYYVYTQKQGGWALETFEPHKFTKPQFIVHEQNDVEWADVQDKIDRLEILNSNHSDQNDATGSPILAVKGEVKGFIARGETGKVFELNDGADMKFVEATGAPESIIDERKNLIKMIYDETFTPQISFQDATSLGANVPGVTMKLFFLPATLKAMNEQMGGWGMSVQRRYNLLLTIMGVIGGMQDVELEVTPKFSIFMPSNDTENYENIVKLVGAGLLSRKKAVAMLNLTDSDEEELKQIEVELEAATKRAAALKPTQIQTDAPPVQE
ncbi:phage portal protein [Pedobacter faecalis]|uniref:phage portal protein n=1 Tax=Pedobacter faecalis TaxID=3041495 RepID=UPI00254F50E4|nr:phage portal protein [Pedobacter sp. ELA7]